ncbi:MAG: hypothetical protein U0031_18735 [Thermomicrobiales bacterium]
MTRRRPDIQTFSPRWPDFRLLPPQEMRLTYDRPSDTLFVDFSGEARAAASVPLDRGDRDYLFLRVDPETEAVVGMQIEHFLSYAIARHPELRAALDVAQIGRIDRGELDGLIPATMRTARADTRDTIIEDLIRLCA